MKALAYVRVSTQGQVDGVSLETQESKIRSYCDANDLELLKVYCDAGLSGGKASNRPALQEALSAIQKGEAGALVVFRLDRLARNTVDALTIAKRLDRRGASLHSLSEKLDTSSATGRFFFALVASLAELERGIIAERTAAAHAFTRAQGLATGHAPFGYALAGDGRTLLPVKREQDVLRKITRLTASGASERAIVAKLNAKGIPAKRGGQWSRASLRSVIATAAKRQAA